MHMQRLASDNEETKVVMHKAQTAHQAYLQDHLQRMHNEIESTTRKLELEKRRLNKLEEDTSRMRVEYTEKVQKNPLEKQEPRLSMQKLESRLAKAMSQLNSLNHGNTEYRQKIDAIRRERLQLVQVFKKLQGDIKDNIHTVSSVHRDNDQARREQEERAHRMAALKKQVELERKQFKTTVKGLQEEFKNREREELIQRVAMAKEASAKQDDEADTTSKVSKTRSLKADEEVQFNTTSVMRRILKLAFLNAIQRRHIRQHQKNIEVFEQAFATIKSTTGISDIEEIVKIFIALEQKNFSLLTYVNALNLDIETFDKQNRQLKEQLANQTEIQEESQLRRETALTDIRHQIEHTSRTTEENKLQATQQSEVTDRCRPVIHSILKTVERENRGFGGQAAPDFTGENMFGWLTYVEKTLTQWKDFLPEAKDARHFKTPSKNYKYTAGNQVLALQPKKSNAAPTSLVKASELPSAANAFLEQGQNPQRAMAAGREEDSSDDEEDLMTHPWSRQELKDKANAAVAKRRRHRRTEAAGGAAGGNQGGQGAESQRDDAGAGAAEGAGELGYEDIVEKAKDGDEQSDHSDESDVDDDIGPTDEEINEIFLKRYKMSKEELQGMANKMGIQLNNLCYLKQEFDAYDEDRSGYIDVKELKGLLEKLGEELSDDELDQAFRELDSDGSGEIEFFEFVEWFTSED